MTDEEWRAMLARFALACDTAVSRAMLRALGIPAREPRPNGTVVVSADRYKGMRECFANKRRVDIR